MRRQWFGSRMGIKNLPVILNHGGLPYWRTVALRLT
jgi:hypothetical protein